MTNGREGRSYGRREFMRGIAAAVPMAGGMIAGGIPAMAASDCRKVATVATPLPSDPVVAEAARLLAWQRRIDDLNASLDADQGNVLSNESMDKIWVDAGLPDLLVAATEFYRMVPTTIQGLHALMEVFFAVDSPADHALGDDQVHIFDTIRAAVSALANGGAA